MQQRRPSATKNKMNFKKEYIQNHSVVSDSLQFQGLKSPWNSLGQNTGVSSLSLLQEFFPTQVSCIAGGSFTAEPQGKPKNTGVGSLSLLQGIFPTQKSNHGLWGLLHCRRILYQLSSEGWWRNPLLSIQNRSGGTKVLERP